MTKEEKFTSVTIYLAKVVDHITGAEEENTKIFYKAPPEQAGITKKTASEIANLLLSAKENETKE